MWVTKKLAGSSFIWVNLYYEPGEESAVLLKVTDTFEWLFLYQKFFGFYDCIDFVFLLFWQDLAWCS